MGFALPFYLIDVENWLYLFNQSNGKLSHLRLGNLCFPALQPVGFLHFQLPLTPFNISAFWLAVVINLFWFCFRYIQSKYTLFLVYGFEKFVISLDAIQSTFIMSCFGFQ